MASVCIRGTSTSVSTYALDRQVRAKAIKVRRGTILKMFIHRRAQFELVKVLAFAHIFITCVSPPLAVADERSVTPAAHPGSARRLPSLSFRVIEGSNHGRLPTEAHAVSHRRSHHRGVNRDENYVPRRVPVSSSRRHAHYKSTDEKESHKGNGNHNKNVNVNSDSNTSMGKQVHFWSFIENDRRPEEETSISKLEGKLQSSITFRVNIITVFGQLLTTPGNGLTVDQYTSLSLILQALAHKRVYMFNILPILKKLQGASRVSQFRLVILALVNNVPAYLTSTCKFWINEIDKHRVGIERITRLIAHPADFLTGIDPEVIDICKVKVAAEELEPIDKVSELTKITLGPVFVNVFVKLKNHQIKLSPKLFGAILAYLPVSKLNPVFEEYINYIWDVAQNGFLPHWPDISMKIKYGNPYELVSFVAKEYLNKGDTPIALKHAFQYILLHLNEFPINNFSDEHYSDMQTLLGNNKVVEKLLFMIPDDLTVPEQSDLRDQMIAIIKQKDIDVIFEGMNKYIYEKPIDLLIALLTRIEGRIQKREFVYTVTKLLSTLVLKEELNSFTQTVPSNVDIMTLLNFLNVPNTNPAISISVQKIQQYLDGNFNLLNNLQNLIPKADKSKCRRPIQCLLYILEVALDPYTTAQLGIPSDLLSVIKHLHYLIKNAINSSVTCQPWGVVSTDDTKTVHNSSDIMFQLIPQHSETTRQPIILTSPEPTETYWPPMSTIPTDYQENPYRPDDPIFPTGKPLEPIYPIHPDEKVEDHTTYPPRLVEEVTRPDEWAKPIEANLFEDKPIRSPIPWSWQNLTQTTESTPIPELIQTFKPPITPPTSTPPKQTLITIPHSYPTEKSPVNHPFDTLPPQTENEPVLPPNLKYDRPIYVVFPTGDAPPYTSLTKPSVPINFGIVVSFPSIKEMMQGFNPNTPFHPNELPEIPEIMNPLKQILGVNFIEQILGKRVDKARYPTVISLMDALLEHALSHPKVMANPKLTASIRLYLKAIDYISMTALFPVVIDSQKIQSNLLYVTFDSHNPNAYSVHPELPKQTSPESIILPIYHPKYWIQQVDPNNPYGTLIPYSSESEDNPIRDMIDNGSLQEILGPDFDPLIYPNRGTLLMTVLQKLMVSSRVKLNPWLTKKLHAYLKTIRTIAMYSKIPSDYGSHLVELQQNNEINWQPDTTSLIVALPPARNQDELHKINLIRSFLNTPNLLGLLQIRNPSYSTTRGTLLKMIFNVAIRDNKLILDPQTLSALKYYESRILTNGHGALPIVWVWVQMFIIREEIPLGDIIGAVLDYDRLSHNVRLSYNSVMTYLSKNPQFLQGGNDFPYEKYRTKGTFLKGLFSHLMTKSGISGNIKRHLRKLIPYVSLVGRGSERMNHVTLDDITKHGIVQNEYSVMLNNY